MKPYFLQNIISSPGYKRIIEDKAVGVTMMNLNVPIVSSLTIPLLPIDMQEQYIAFMQQTDKSKFEIQQSLEKLETLKKALMQKYFG
jgi:type I restriction enzyme S subunit